MIGGGVVKILSKSFQGNIYIDQYDNVGGLHWHVCVAQNILCGKNLHCVSREIKWWRDFSSLFHVPNDVAY